MWYREGMDWDSAGTVFAITFGHAIGGAIVGAFYSWKAKRAEVRMVQNRRGEFVDIAEVYERRAWIAWSVFVVAILGGNAYIFATMP